jgi:hypothetical protein
VIVALVIFGFVGKSNEMLTDQLRASARDRQLMSRIAVDLERLPAFQTVEKVMFVGVNTGPISRLATAADISRGWGAYGTTISVFAAFFGEQGYLIHLLNETRGYRFPHDVSNEDLDRAKNGCRERPAWPSDGSVFVEARWAIVCLGGSTDRIIGPFNVK